MYSLSLSLCLEMSILLLLRCGITRIPAHAIGTQGSSEWKGLCMTRRRAKLFAPLKTPVTISTTAQHLGIGWMKEPALSGMAQYAVLPAGVIYTMSIVITRRQASLDIRLRTLIYTTTKWLLRDGIP